MEEYNTLKSYNESAQKYFEDTKKGDMIEHYDKFLMLLPDKAYILDFGCGSGRDSKYFLEHGYEVKAIDGSIELCKLAEKHIGQEVKCMKFDELSDNNVYDGIWACSSILHVERENLPDILKKMIKALKENGVIYTCFKKGDKIEIKDNKYYNYITKEILEDILKEIDTNAEIIDYYENNTCANINRPQTIWGNYLIKKRVKE